MKSLKVQNISYVPLLLSNQNSFSPINVALLPIEGALLYQLLLGVGEPRLLRVGELRHCEHHVLLAFGRDGYLGMNQDEIGIS